MLALTAEDPDRLSVVDLDGEDGDLLLVGASSNGHEAGPDAGNRAVDLGNGRTRVIKVGLCDGVVASPELELDHGTGSSLDVVRVVLGGRLSSHTSHGVLTNGNDVDVNGLKEGNVSLVI